MNIVKMLEKQKENGKDIILADGNIISKDEIKKANLKTYLAGLKAGEISPSMSLDQYSAEAGDNFVTIDDMIDIIKNGIDEADAAE